MSSRRLRGCIIAVALLGTLPLLLFFLLLFGEELPTRLIGSGVEDFEGVDRRMADAAYTDVTVLYGDGFLDILEYTGPSLVLGWHVESVEKCPDTPSGEKFERMVETGGGLRAEVGAYTLFGIPRGKVLLSCRSNPKWEPYF